MAALDKGCAVSGVANRLVCGHSASLQVEATPLHENNPSTMTALRLLLAAALTAAAARPLAKPIEAYVSPPELFAIEGNYEGRTPRPLDVYDSQRAKVVGRIEARQGCEGDFCTWVFELRLATGKASRLEVEEWSYETLGLVTYADPVQAAGGQVWSRLDTPLGAFWVRTPKVQVHRFEELVSVVEDPAVWCTQPGRCAKTPSAVAAELKRLAPQLSCYASPYQVEGTVTVAGKRYYRMVLPQPLPDDVRTSLPAQAFVPVRDAHGEHTGTFSPRGC